MIESPDSPAALQAPIGDVTGKCDLVPTTCLRPNNVIMASQVLDSSPSDAASF